jgi:hypothetical protein
MRENFTSNAAAARAVPVPQRGKNLKSTRTQKNRVSVLSLDRLIRPCLLRRRSHAELWDMFQRLDFKHDMRLDMDELRAALEHAGLWQ